jgi:hypothetical protein
MGKRQRSKSRGRFHKKSIRSQEDALERRIQREALLHPVTVTVVPEAELVRFFGARAGEVQCSVCDAEGPESHL